ncbi:MAG TPA: recombination protein RecR [Candidatus Egerieisoma faecipullorum]|uniref:Recombination protein RecR n=1 Tax=Candidatus Egerieisoma faecipullorum TaxID=2840963 RepID=A0A9D1IAZ3_9CLOT|nr:recombination protein RecR [Candidatus Egerieisoma faecipullorum]
MGVYGASVTKLIEQFEKLPGIGRKSAQRMAFYLLGRTEQEAEEFAEAIKTARRELRYCKVCQNIADREICDICANPARSNGKICVVEDPRDVMAMERSKVFTGRYHVLHGVLSPVNDVGPDEIRIKELLARIDDSVKEVILATNPNVEGEATAMYIARLIKPLGVTVTRIAHGVPVGGDLEYVDEVTIARALENRKEL